jgi:serine/threonine protein kinase
MTLAAGTRLGPYEIISPIGAGGMGEVYRARDTRLERTVAIKVLPALLSSDQRLKQRFEQEARAISSLNHPHICTLHDVGTQDDVSFLVMEYIEGETLSHRLQKGALPFEQALKVGTEIADALEKAHRRGIVHRDLKPGNIMLTKTGAKLMDFGLAKPAPVVMEIASSATIPTASMALTAEGTIVGTLQYMSPEQLEGKEADARSDIFALGAVLYEMFTGRQAFTGSSRASVIAAILTSEPPSISQSQPLSPLILDHVIKHALTKNPDERWQSAHDTKIALGGIAISDERRFVTTSQNIWRIAAGLLALTSLSLVAFLVLQQRNPTPTLLRLAIPPPPGARFSAFEKLLAISPDGRQVAFTAIDQNGQRLLWIRPLDSLEVRALPGTDDADSPFWSPDSRHIGFFSHSKLKKIDPTGGQPEVICDAGADPGGATWNRDGVIVFAPNWEGVLYRVAASGGQPVPVTEADKAHNETEHLFPEFLPDGRHFLFFVGGRGDAGIHVGSLDSREHHIILRESSWAAYSETGYLLFGRSGVLMAQHFDAKRAQTSGEPVRILDAVESAPGGGYSFSVSRNGVLVYWAGQRFDPTQLVWYRRDGTRVGTLGSVGPFRLPRMSPDGQAIAVTRLDGSGVWLIDSRGVSTRLTFGELDLSPVWASDGNGIIFASPREELPPNLFRKTLVGGSEEQRLMRSVVNSIPTDWSRDGRYVVYMTNELGTNWNIWAMPLADDRTPQPVLRSQFNEMDARISPDSRWLAYVSDESGKWEVYVQRFLSPGAKWRISTTGGNQPQWSHNGQELFYVASDQKLMAVPVQTGSSLNPGPPKQLFQVHTAADFFGTEYDVSADGQRFLVNTLVGEKASEPLTVVFNWPALLNKN